MRKQPQRKTKTGSAILLSMILLFVILALVASLSYVTVMEQKMSGKTKSSVGAFYNSESGVEWALNKIANAAGNATISGVFSEFSNSKTPCPSGFSCDVYFLDARGNVISSSATLVSDLKAFRSVGTQGDETQRAIEAAVAAGGGTYTVFGQNTCPSGSLVYSGVAVSSYADMSGAGGGTSRGLGGLVCVTNWSSFRTGSTSGTGFLSGSGTTADRVDLPCAVCGN